MRKTLKLEHKIYEEEDFIVRATCEYSEKDDGYRDLKVVGTIPSMGLEEELLFTQIQNAWLAEKVALINWSEVAKRAKIHHKFDTALKQKT